MTDVIDTSANTSFSRQLPGLQLALDSTSLGAFKRCPRFYEYTVVQGWVPRAESVHLTFGILVHGALERYHHGKARGLGHDDALDMALDWTLQGTWNKDLGRGWISDHRTKNRATLIRTIVWYLDKFEHDPLETIILDNGKPAVELSFSFWSGFTFPSTGEPLTLCGHMDRLATLNGEPYILDPKTTEHTISPSWFAKFTPHNQFSLYSLAGQVAYKVPVKGLIVDGIQVAVGFSRFERALVPRSESQLTEWHRDAMRVARHMEQNALDGYWEMDDSACDMYGGCPFRGICARPPASREQWLRAEFKQRIWDPLKRRGDI